MGCGISSNFSNFHRQHQDALNDDLGLGLRNSTKHVPAPRARKAGAIVSDGNDFHDNQEAQDARPGPVTVFPTINSQPDSDAPLEGLAELRKKCPRFRILIIGKANAGKTTILQKFCKTTENPVIHNQDGQQLDLSTIQPTDGRGIHNINSELTFSTNDSFVFHDSRGFEASSVTELEDVQEFIAKRAARNELKDQLHAIWYCLPTDGDRPLSDAEMTFFKQGTGQAPVIAIFTKYDGMVLKEYNRLRYEGNYTRQQAKEQAPVVADWLFKESEFYLKRLQTAPHPPAKSLRMQDMQNPSNNCAELSRQTLEALNSKRLQQLFVSVQQNNLGLSTEFALREFMLKAFMNAGGYYPAPATEIVPQGMMVQPESAAGLVDIAKQMLTCYRHLFRREDYSYKIQDFVEHRNSLNQEHGVVQDNLDFITTILSKTSQSPLSFQILHVGTAVLIVAEDSFWREDETHQSSAFEPAAAAYEASARNVAVIEAINTKLSEACAQDPSTYNEEEFIKMVLELVRGFRAQA